MFLVLTNILTQTNILLIVDTDVPHSDSLDFDLLVQEAKNCKQYLSLPTHSQKKQNEAAHIAFFIICYNNNNLIKGIREKFTRFLIFFLVVPLTKN